MRKCNSCGRPLQRMPRSRDLPVVEAMRSCVYECGALLPAGWDLNDRADRAQRQIDRHRIHLV